ncbi:MAG: ABC transporter ATP-binding protein [Clostridiales bacterium]|nr:ABC transporter ATP-binding protein [Clostridiales bacterium]
MKFLNNLKFMLQFIGKHNKLWLFLTALNTVLHAVSPLMNMILPKYIIDAIFEEKSFYEGMYWAAILVGSNLLVQYMSGVLGYMLAKQKNKLFCAFNTYIAELVMDMDYKELENPETLDMKEKAMRSAFSGGRGFCGSVEVFFGIMTSVIVFIGAALKMTELNPLLVLVILAVVVLNTLFNSKINKDNYKLDQEKAPIERKNGYVFNLISDFTIGKEVRIYGLKDYIINKYKETASESNRFYNKAFWNNTKNGLFSSTTANLQLIFVYFILFVQVFNHENFTYGDFSVQFNAVNTLSQSLLSIISSVLAINQMGFYIDDLIRFVQLPRITYDQGITPEKCPVYHFDFVNVSFKYPGANEYALKNINLHFSTDQKLSFVGLNGAGKTTFVKLLLRLYDVSDGEILLNGINVKDYNYSEYVTLFSSVFQDYKLFAYSVQENIVLSENNPDQERLEKAMQESGVNSFINGKEKGINSFVYKIFDASGFEPSGGEGQKIAIARALYKDAKFVILDEPTSALDPIAEYDLYNKLHHLVRNKGCLFISHRLSSTIFADQIFVFENGEIVERGSHKELMLSTDGLYKNMFEKQASYYKENECFDNRDC